jgi:hypothetical protein
VIVSLWAGAAAATSKCPAGLHPCLDLSQWLIAVFLPLAVGAGLAGLSWTRLRAPEGGANVRRNLAVVVLLGLGGLGSAFGYAVCHAFLAPCCG